jgi:UDP-GlcNAc:undecaprenyl-phosphate GlcNAc-1-phosphate transferase
MMQYLGYFLLSFIIAYVTTPFIRRFAERMKIYAVPNHRTMHEGIIPKLGGGSILLAFMVGVVVSLAFHMEWVRTFNPQLFSMLAGATILFVMGAIDDKLDLNCNLKLFIELAVASLAVIFGWRADIILMPVGMHINLGVLSVPLSILWIVGITNSFNMIDGLDGLAGGIALVVLFVTMAVAALFGHPLVMVMSALLLGAIAGFLRFNISPATIFMGDSGSLSIGFMLACFSLSAAAFEPGKTVMIVPVLLLALPITDTSLAIVRRVRRGIHPFKGDREHIHHRLVNLGLSASGAAMVMVGVTLIFGIMAFLIAQVVYTDVKLFGQLVRF